MKFAKLSGSLVLASVVFTSLMPAARADDSAFGKLADKIQCSDASLGSNTQNDIGRSSSSRQNSASNSNSAWGNASQSQSNKKTHNDGGGGSVSVLGIFSVGGSGGSKGSSESNASSSSAYGRNNASNSSSKNSNSRSHDRSSSTVVVGKNCDSNNEAAAYLGGKLVDRDMNKDTINGAIEINKTNAEVSKYGIDAQVKINTDNNKTAVDLFNAQRRSGAVNNLVQWYTPQK